MQIPENRLSLKKKSKYFGKLYTIIIIVFLWFVSEDALLLYQILDFRPLMRANHPFPYTLSSTLPVADLLSSSDIQP